jgi:hypothetical protein
LLNVFVAHPAFTPAELLKSTSAEDLVGSDLVVTGYAALLRLDWFGKTRWRLRRRQRGAGDQVTPPPGFVAGVARRLGGVGRDRNWVKAHQS